MDTKTERHVMQGQIIQLDYDFITSLSGECLYCLTNAQVQMILGFVDFYRYRTRWYSEDGTIDQQVILDLQGGLVKALMNGCCPDNSVLFRWTADGHYQTSNDGGTTWADSPSEDPRNPQPVNPPFLPPDTTDATCTYADSIVSMLKTELVDKLATDASYTEVIGIIITVFTTLMGALAPTVIGALVVGILGAIAVGIVAVSIPAFQAAMTSDVYHRFRCNLNTHIETDGTFTKDDVDAVYAQIGSDETGLAALFLQGFVAAAGTIGLSNAARSGHGAIDANCDCTDHIRVFVVDTLGTEDSWDGEFLTCTAIAGGPSNFILGIQFSEGAYLNNINACGKATFEILSGSIEAAQPVVVACASSTQININYNQIVEQCLNTVLFVSTVSFQIKVSAVVC